MTASGELDPVKLYAILANLLTRSDELSEIAVSPYILPLPDANEDSSSSAFASEPSSSSSNPSAPQPTSIHPFSLLDGDKLVIPQKPLYKAYAVAIKAFARYSRKEVDQALGSEALDRDSEDVTAQDTLARLDKLTRVILVQNPEHLRALNFRKKIILRKVSKAHRMQIDVAVHPAIHDELHLARLVLGIAANAKMATLWHHRKWLLSLLFQKKEALTKYVYNLPSMPLPHDTLEQELELVDQCSSRYPRNYNAWAYRAWLIRGADADQIQVEWDRITTHLRTNITDHTAVVHALNTLLPRTADEGREKDLLDIAHDLVERYPYKETPWLFVRGLVMKLGDQQVVLDAQSLAQRILAEARVTLEKYPTKDEQRETSWAAKEAQKAAEHALRTAYFLSAIGDPGHPDYGSLGSMRAKALLER